MKRNYHYLIIIFICLINHVNAQTDKSQEAITELQDWLATSKVSRSSMETLTYIDTPLSREAAEEARDLVADDYIENLKSIHQNNFDNDLIKVNDLNFKFITKSFGDPNVQGGRSLIISMHGGIFSNDAGNDQQWENQKNLYNNFPNNYVLIVPRVPLNIWNGWHIWETEMAYDIMISLAIEKYNLNRNKIILVGYSAGGDGVYELSPRMGDVISASGMFAGTNNFSNPFNLHRVTWAGRIGERDTAFNRNNVMLEYEQKIVKLQDEHSDFVHDVALEPGLPHWMNNKERSVFPLLFDATRNPFHEKILWKQSGVGELPQRMFYNLKATAYKPGTEVIVTFDRDNAEVNIDRSGYNSGELEVFVRDENVNMEQAITVSDNQTIFFQGKIVRTLRSILETSELNEGDPDRIYYGSVMIENKDAGTNLAPEAISIEVSSEFSSNFDKNKLIDGFSAGSGEWASMGEQEPSVKFTWDQPIITKRIALYDRPNLSDNVKDITIRFSDGTTINKMDLAKSDGQLIEISFEERVTEWIEIEVDRGEGPNVGLLEVEVFGKYGSTLNVDDKRFNNSDFLVYKAENQTINAELKDYKATSTTSFTYSLYDIQGRLLLREKSMQANIKINSSTLSSGIYILSVENNDLFLSKKFVLD